MHNPKKGGDRMSGIEVKKMILDNGLKLWQVADKLGITDGNFSRKLRFNFNDEEVSNIKNIISSLKPEN